MTRLKIRYYPDPVLAKKAEPLEQFGKEEQKLFKDMIDTMFAEDGVGLAAPQVGISKRIFVACPATKREEVFIIVNPEVLESQGRELGTEGCLSLPGVSGEVPRAKRLRLRYQDEHGQRHEITARDFFARVIQHEIDHLDGMLIIDRLEFHERQEALAAYAGQSAQPAARESARKRL